MNKLNFLTNLKYPCKKKDVTKMSEAKSKIKKLTIFKLSLKIFLNLRHFANHIDTFIKKKKHLKKMLSFQFINFSRPIQKHDLF